MYVWNDVEGVERSLNSSNCYSCYSCQKGRKITLCTQYRYIQCYVERVKRSCCIEIKDIHIFAHNFLNIQAIFNPKKVLESWDLDLSNHTIQCNVCWSMSKGSKVEITFDPFDIHSIGLYGWKGLSLSFPKLFADWKSVKY